MEQGTEDNTRYVIYFPNEHTQKLFTVLYGEGSPWSRISYQDILEQSLVAYNNRDENMKEVLLRSRLVKKLSQPNRVMICDSEDLGEVVMNHFDLATLFALSHTAKKLNLGASSSRASAPP